MSRKKHPWKICPIGEYYVKGHFKTINGKETHWEGHCRVGQSSKDVLNADEIKEISKRFKNKKLKLPKSYNFQSKAGNKYDILIAGWVKYWSDIFGSDTSITPDFVKVLMMTESTFRDKVKAVTHNRAKKGQAMGLMQITDYTFKLIQQNEKELRSHSFNLKRSDIFEPSVNVAVGIRWLFRKREIAKYYLKKEPSPLQLAEEYKGIRKDQSPKAQKQRESFKLRWKEYRDEK